MEINDLTHTIIGCAYKVHNVLGFGFLERVYENALRIELEKLGTHPHSEVSFTTEPSAVARGRITQLLHEIDL